MLASAGFVLMPVHRALVLLGLNARTVEMVRSMKDIGKMTKRMKLPPAWAHENGRRSCEQCFVILSCPAEAMTGWRFHRPPTYGGPTAAPRRRGSTRTGRSSFQAHGQLKADQPSAKVCERVAWRPTVLIGKHRPPAIHYGSDLRRIAHAGSVRGRPYGLPPTGRITLSDGGDR